MQEKERLDSEAAEKRLKAALTAKKDPAGASTVSSPVPETVPDSVQANGNLSTGNAVPSIKAEHDVPEDIVMELSPLVVKLETPTPVC